ncbi:MAG: hypothetical protein QW193_05310 [Nitrososphaerales archaeon]
MGQKGVATGLEPEEELWNIDIYCLLEAPQELFFGLEPRVEVSIIETVKVPIGPGKEDYMIKCYLSPTKRRGIERRALLYTIVKNNENMEVPLADMLKCGIPITCCDDNCIVCRLYGGLIVGENLSLQGRLYHGGGTAVQPIGPVEKFRSRVPTLFKKGSAKELPKEYIDEAIRATKVKEEDVGFPMPFKRQYAEPGHVFPVSNHGLLLNEFEINATSFAFLKSLSLLGSGTPKGVSIFYGPLFRDIEEPYLVFDIYKVPLGSRILFSPFEVDLARVIERFKKLSTELSLELRGQKIESENFKRYVGEEALNELRMRSKLFYNELPNYLKMIQTSKG